MLRKRSPESIDAGVLQCSQETAIFTTKTGVGERGPGSVGLQVEGRKRGMEPGLAGRGGDQARLLHGKERVGGGDLDEEEKNR